MKDSSQGAQRREGPHPRAQQLSTSLEKLPTPYEYEAFGILNPHGDIWTPEWFHTEREALAHVRRFFHGFNGKPWKKFKAVPVAITIRALPSEREASAHRLDELGPGRNPE
jgi:hypothetical protein